MAKSKSGGTRSMIRGRVGSDVYSVGRDAKGKKQQVVRSLAESVANPQTQSQMRGRMIMSTLAQVIAVLRPIIDHAFDGMVGARANLAQFTSQNYALIKADVASHPSTGNKFGLVAYKEKGAKQGCYVISDGQAVIPGALVLTKTSGIVTITMASDAITIGGLKAALGMTSEEYFTLVGLKTDGEAAYERFRVNPTLADNTAISASNIADVFAVEGNAVATIAVADNVITITLASVAGDCAVIVSKKTAAGYIHNKAVLGDGSNFAAPADTALPTYPVGAENYLNGGDIFGQSESFNPGDEPGPTPSPTQSAISGVTINGANLAQSGTAQLNAGSNVLVVSVVAGTDSANYAAACLRIANAVVGQAVASGDQHAISGGSASFSVNGDSSATSHKVVLVRDNVITQVWGTLTQPAAPTPTGEPTLTAFTVNSKNLLDPSATDTSFNGEADVTYEGSDLNGSVVALSSNKNLSVGSSLDVSQIAETQKLTLTGNSGTGSITTVGGKRYYLVASNVVKQVLGQDETMDKD